ncbi:hypothetical protein BBO99_00004632 [Phytophthora kernoviae]|uniref:Uncharacterized protein n=2 Tax=Phytophthora kernoviae TaxID=325452 RepID=A0A3R7HIY4_9STRA|nr:hypothetical protein G195_009298 [Phytophthora kernoviae 00238/432]KAG2515043.1 hypothetical protein JM16_007796 [Phytophthora kernoviae]KAG2518518.1 hypothetical protein JM18_007717 [Phytophthora kernoviae]RLN26670.1 hypothetical protein BBI17_004616 [Phytophthora kernoviae]RLN80266.1 hypothetical protein BBO99_00004632 [Phytophthora kernoviae]
MRTRIWEDAAAMSVVSVLGFIMNEDGEVVGSERTQVLCQLMPSIHTLSHRAILALLITQLSDADAQVFYAEGGLKVLNAWLSDRAARREPGMSKEKKRIEMFSQILDVNVQTDALRKLNSYLTDTLPKVIELLDNAGPDYAAEWSRLNIYRRHFESSCGRPSTPKSFLQKDQGPNKPDEDGLEEFVEDDDEDMLGDEGVITNVNQAALSASLEQKIRGNGHDMQYGERAPCRKCKRMASKRCLHCEFCAKCGQKDKCEPVSVSPVAPASSSNGSDKKAGGNGIGGKALSVKDRNVQVLGSVMDAAIYHAFRQEDFHSVFSLIQNGMDVNFQRVESDLSSALMAAAHHGRDDAASKLLSLGANPCLEDRGGNKAWNFAERRGHTELMEKLKKCGEEWEKTHKEPDVEKQP